MSKITNCLIKKDTSGAYATGKAVSRDSSQRNAGSPGSPTGTSLPRSVPTARAGATGANGAGAHHQPAPAGDAA